VFCGPALASWSPARNGAAEQSFEIHHRVIAGNAFRQHALHALENEKGGECVTRRRKSFSKRLIEIGEGRRCGLGVRRTNPIHVMARNSGPPSCDRSARRHREESSPRLRMPGQFHLGGPLLRAVTNRGAVLRWYFVAGLLQKESNPLRHRRLPRRSRVFPTG